jgi:hypothetical protein
MAGSLDASGLTEIRHFGAESSFDVREWRSTTVAFDIGIEQAFIRWALFLQQAMSAHLISDAVEPATGRTAFMQGAAEAGAPTQRTLTSASAQLGITAWTMISMAASKKAIL